MLWAWQRGAEGGRGDDETWCSPDRQLKSTEWMVEDNQRSVVYLTSTRTCNLHTIELVWIFLKAKCTIPYDA